MDSLRVVSGLPHYTTTTMPKKRGTRARGSIRGRGDYSSTTKSIKDPMTRLESKIDHLESKLVKDIMSKSNAAATIGRTLGNFAGQGDLGALAGQSLAKWFGHGDYKVHSNSLIKGSLPTGASFSRDGRRGTRIIEREYIGDIISGSMTGASTDFTVQGFSLNPTDPQTFPWLSRLAALYDQWEPNGIVFEFVSTSSDYNGASQALGAVIIATDYDGLDPAYSSKQEMENSDYACSTKPSDNLLHGIECDPAERPTPILYTSRENRAVHLSTLGVTQVATQGCSVAGVTLGELWISYDITFFKKQLHSFESPTPFLASLGETTPNGPYIISPSASDTITMTQTVGSGTTLHLNNSVADEYYMLVYRIGTLCTTVDESAWANTVEVNCNAAPVRIVPTGSGEMEVVFKVRTLAANATIFIPKDASGGHVYRFTIVRTPSGIEV